MSLWASLAFFPILLALLRLSVIIEHRHRKPTPVVETDWQWPRWKPRA